jgi:hypothetical protein
LTCTEEFDVVLISGVDGSELGVTCNDWFVNCRSR